MKLASVTLDQAEGKILAHNIAGSDGRRAFRKGKLITAGDVALLREMGFASVYAAHLTPEDVSEDVAAKRVALAAAGMGIQSTGAASGRVNLQANIRGVAVVDISRLTAINLTEGITLATIPNHSLVHPRQIIATIKIIPFAIPDSLICEIEQSAMKHGPIVHVDELKPQPVGVIISGSTSIRQRLIDDFQPLWERTSNLGSQVEFSDFVEITENDDGMQMAETLRRQCEAGARLIIMAGETAIMDRDDLAPRAIELAGGHIEALGAPVDPGNLLMVAYIGDVPVIGAPGCARSRKINVIDWVLPRLLAGARLTRADIAMLGHGGLLEDVPERPMPRHKRENGEHREGNIS